MVRYLFYTIGDFTYQSPLVHNVVSTNEISCWIIKAETQTKCRAVRSKKSWKVDDIKKYVPLFDSIVTL